MAFRAPSFNEVLIMSSLKVTSATQRDNVSPLTSVPIRCARKASSGRIVEAATAHAIILIQCALLFAVLDAPACQKLSLLFHFCATIMQKLLIFLAFASLLVFSHCGKIQYLTDLTFCGENTYYTEDYHCSVPSCAVPEAECSPKWKFRGCVCKDGHLRNDLYQCVPRKQCKMSKFAIEGDF
uniref:TIL domain-containing protein n=2 Tax=Steinernema glaseri TaxID=37863 RepID=A0A1I7YU76_9BILA